jgi:hypothetical protein
MSFDEVFVLTVRPFWSHQPASLNAAGTDTEAGFDVCVPGVVCATVTAGVVPPVSAELFAVIADWFTDAGRLTVTGDAGSGPPEAVMAEPPGRACSADWTAAAVAL